MAAFGASGSGEYTFFDLDVLPPGEISVLGLDGCSERLRRMAGKPITDEMASSVIGRLVANTGTRRMTRFYNISGYPGETEADIEQLVDLFVRSDRAPPAGQKPLTLSVQTTPFLAFPATPAACWPMSLKNQRGRLWEAARRMGHGAGGWIMHDGEGFTLYDSFCVDGPPSTALNAIIHRGTESDSDGIKALARTPAFWSASTARKMATLDKTFDLDKIIGDQEPETLPSRYLRSYAYGGRFHQSWRARLKGATR